MKKTSVKGNGLILISTVLLILVSNGLALGAKTYQIKQGDTLWDLSNKFYGDPFLYSVFLEVNDIDNPRAMLVGDTIIVPSVDEMRKVSSESDPERRKSLIRNAQGNQSSALSSSPNASSKAPPKLKPNGEKGNPGEESKKIDPKKVSFSNVLSGPRVPGNRLKKVGKKTPEGN